MEILSLVLLWLQLSLPRDQWRLVHPNGAVEAVLGTPRLSEEERARVVAAWTWSERRAPRRVSPAEIGRASLGDEATRLAIRVVRRAAGRPPADLRVVAGPREMWIDMPEAALPSWPVPKEGRLSIPLDPSRPWRLRVAGRGEGSWWVDLPAGQKAALLTTAVGVDVEIAVLDARGAPVRPVQGSFQEGTARGGVARLWTVLRGEEGRLEAPGLPDEQELSLTVRDPGSAPLLLRGRPSTLPRVARLSPGAELTGRLLDPRGAPLAGVPVEAETWGSRELPQIHRVKTRSGARGEWRLRGLPAGQVALTFRAPGYVPVIDTLEVEEGSKDLGARTLEPGTELALQVLDDGGAPVPGARINAGGGRIVATADGQGVARLSGVPAAPLEVKGSAERHLAGGLRLNPPFPAAPRLLLPRALTLTGRLVDPSGVPVGRGSVQVESGSCQTESRLGESGRFTLDVLPATTGQLVLRSSTTQELRVRLLPGQAGEARDLGDLRAPAGLTVLGRVVRVEDGTAVPGARVWTTRQGPDGPAVAWAARDLLETTAGEDGRFRLAGLLPAPAVLRVEAAGFARGQASLPLDASPGEDGTVDLGTIALGAGATLRVSLDPRSAGMAEKEGAVARADVGNRWLDPDLLTAPVREGEAVLSNVPAGRVTVTVLAGRRLLCEQTVAVPEGGELAVDCRRRPLAVAGQVQVGGTPAAGGTLTWQIPNLEVPGRIDNLESPAGLRLQQVTGLGRPQVDVAVGPDGRFETDELVPGRWRVTWSAGQGEAGGALAVLIPEGTGERFDTVLPFDGMALTGVVIDRDGRPAPGARVRELGSGTLAFAGEDGGFSLAGLHAGRAMVQAERRDEKSPVAEIELGGARAPEPLRLTLGDRQAPTVAVAVASASGAPVAGAFVFFEEEGKGQRLVTTGSDGRAVVTLEAPLPRRMRAAAFAAGAWGFGPWTARESAEEGLAVALSGDGTLRVAGGKRQGSPRVVSEGGWEIGWLLRLLGAPPTLSAERPFELSGLPGGRYTVSLDGASVTVTVEPGQPGEARIE